MVHPKGALIERCKRLGLAKPRFKTTNTGPEHEPTFVSDVLIGGEVYGTGQGSNKRDAERRASEEALQHLDNEQTTSTPSENGAPSARSVDTAEAFEGPWPIFPEVLAGSLAVANSRIDTALRGEEAAEEVKNLALKIYKESLESLGEVVELED